MPGNKDYSNGYSAGVRSASDAMKSLIDERERYRSLLKDIDARVKLPKDLQRSLKWLLWGEREDET